MYLNTSGQYTASREWRNSTRRPIPGTARGETFHDQSGIRGDIASLPDGVIILFPDIIGKKDKYRGIGSCMWRKI